MGIAAIAVVACHFHNYIANGILGRILGEGFIGVDIFILCSGYGLACSWKKYSTLKSFYCKRATKILPAFLFITTAVLCICTFIGTISYSIKNWFSTLTCLGYWLGTDVFFEWYTPAILFLYICFPLLMKMNSAHAGLKYVKGGIIALCTSFVVPPYFYWLVARIPIFILGTIIGYEYKKDLPIKEFVIVGLCGVILKGLVLSGYITITNLNVLSSSLMAPMLLALIVKCLESLPIAFTKVFSSIGVFSYELFLVHFSMIRYDIVTVFNPIVCLTLSFPIAYLNRNL